ncbi:universal stress protein A-like protein isoform X2 [Cucumis melo]|uniref:Universal stress protein A-like protein isoform X2 n=1 Tax=Cucumis melo TaxID=3656 RepID=A0A1S3BSL9_CUCME|nr:universal stress protein A-like protein isoform X2 [Cucumis melo]
MAATTTTKKPVMLIGIDESEYAIGALEWTLNHFFSSTINPPLFKLILLHAKPIPEIYLDISGPGILDQNLKNKAGNIMKKAKEICATRSVCDVEFEVEEGDARNVLCEGVNKYGASMLVVGSHGYGAIKRALLGSVSDYCAHHAQCTVIIVKPKPHT